MGKRRSKKNEKQIGRKQITEVDLELYADGSVTETETSSLPAVRQLVIQLDHASIEEKDSGLNSITHFCDQKEYLTEILKPELGVIKRVSALVNDDSKIIRHSSTKALRNISAQGSHACDVIVKEKGATNVCIMLEKFYSDGMDMSMGINKNKGHLCALNTIEDCFVDAVTLLKNLCISSEEALRIFNQKSVTHIFKKHLDIEKNSPCILLPIAQCMFTISEDNPEGIEDCNLIHSTLEKIALEESSEYLSADLIQIKLLCSGVLLNLTQWDLSKWTEHQLNKLLCLIKASFDMQPVALCNSFSSDLPCLRLDVSSTNSNIVPSDSDQYTELLSSIDAVTVGMEILANLLSNHEENQEEVNLELLEDDDIPEDDNLEDDSPKIPNFISANIMKGKIVSAVFCKIRCLPVNVKEILSSNCYFGVPVLRSYHRMLLTALICGQNLLDAMDIDWSDSELSFSNEWVAAEKMLSKKELSSNNDLREAFTSFIRSMVDSYMRSLNSKSMTNSSILSPNFGVWTAMYAQENIVKIKVNLIRIIGGIGSLMSKKHTKKSEVAVELEEGILQAAVFLLDCLKKLKASEDTIWVHAETLDCLIDIFSEDDLDHIAEQVDLIPKLSSFFPSFKKMACSKRKMLGEHAAIVETVCTNIPRLIQYFQRKDRHL